MLTTEQVKTRSEIRIKTSEYTETLTAYGMTIYYFKDDKICRLGNINDFIPPIHLMEESLQGWGEDEVKALISVDEWERFTNFINNSETLDEGMLLSYQEVKTIMDESTGHKIGTYKMLRHGKIEDIDVEANIRTIYNMAVDACKVLCKT